MTTQHTPAEPTKPPGMAVQALSGEIVEALLADEKDGGYDPTAGRFGPAFSKLIRRWAVAEWNAPQAQQPAIGPDYKPAHEVWQRKTEWVQETAQPHELGMHRADVLRQRIEQLKTQRDELLEALKSAWLWMENQSEAQSKGGHATFDLMMLRYERDMARAAIKKATGEIT